SSACARASRPAARDTPRARVAKLHRRTDRGRAANNDRRWRSSCGQSNQPPKVHHAAKICSGSLGDRVTTGAVADMTAAHAWLAVEFLVLFVGVPLAMTRRWLPRHPIPVLAAAALVCAGYLLAQRSFDRTLLWNGAAVVAEARAITLVVLALAP